MSQNKEKINENVQDLDESAKNEEDLLGFSSKYKTSLYNEEDFKENEIELWRARKRLSGDSTSFSISQEYSNMSGCNLKKMNSSSKEGEFSHRSIGFEDSSKKYIDFQKNQRKMSSPIYCYYDGSDIYLSKNQKNTVDMNNSQNFIKKERYFNNSDKMVNKVSNINKNINNINIGKNNNLNINLFGQNQNFSDYNNNVNNSFNNSKISKNQQKLTMKNNQINYNNINNINNINQIQNNNFSNNNFFFQNNNCPQLIYNINYININNFKNNPVNNTISKRKLSYNIEEEIIGNCFNNILNINNNNMINQNQQILNVNPSSTKLNPMLFSYNEEHERNFPQFNIKNNNSNNKPNHNNSKNDKKPFDKRKGDWLCPECHNLNFAFRIICNRCQLPKPSNSITSNEQ